MNRFLTPAVLSLLAFAACVPDRAPSNDPETYRAAIHEAGHAVFALANPKTFCVKGVRVGHDQLRVFGTTDLEIADGEFPDMASLQLLLAERLAGQVAEELIFRETSLGADKDDVKIATLAQRISMASGDDPWIVIKDAKAAAIAAIKDRRAAIERIGRTLTQSSSLGQNQIALLYRQG